MTYLVKWKGFSFDECTWEPAANLKGSRKIVNQYRKSESLAEDYLAVLQIEQLAGRAVNAGGSHRSDPRICRSSDPVVYHISRLQLTEYIRVIQL